MTITMLKSVRWLYSTILLFASSVLANLALAAPTITNPSSGSILPSVAVGEHMSITISSSGGKEPLWRWIGCDADTNYNGEETCLPAGLILDRSDGSASTVLHGAIMTEGTYTFSVSILDDYMEAGVATYTLQVVAATLTSVSPNTGTTAGGTTVTLTGNYLTGASAVSFGNTPATHFTVNSATSITATAPPHAVGMVDIVVTTPTGTIPLPNSYTYTSAIPTASPVNQPVPANTSNNPINLMLGGGAATSVAVDTSPSHGTATVIGTSITYTPTAGYSGQDSFTYTATNASGTSAPATVSIIVTPAALDITTGSLASGTVGSAYSQTLSSTNGTAPYTYTITGGSLPAGLTLSSTGVLSGTPSADGSFNFTVSVEDAYGATGSLPYTLQIAVQAPTASSVNQPVAANSIANSIGLALGGGAATSVTVHSSPSHGSASSSGTSITYTPTTGYSGPDSFTYTATNASGTSAPATVSIIVTPAALDITTGSLASGTVGSAYSQTLSTTNGTAPYTYTITAGSLPAGLTLSSTGVLSGTPSADGSFNFTVSVEDAYGATGSLPYTLQIAVQAPTASSVSQPVAANSIANSIGLALGGGAATSVTVYSSPSHGSASSSGTSIYYTPTTGYSGPDSFTYTATNASGTSSHATVTITVTPATLAINPVSLSGGIGGSAYSQTLSATNGTAPYTYTITAGSLPAGLSLSFTGVLSGTPSANGSFNFTVSAEDTYGATGSRAYTLQIAVQAPTASAVNSTVTANTSNNQINLILGGGAATSVAVDTSPSHGTATVSGTDIAYTPTTGYSGPDSFTYTATNASGTSAPATVSIIVTPAALDITTGSLASGTVGSAYSQTLSATNGTAPYTYTITGGSLPPGLTLSSTGVLSGTPSVDGSFNFTVSVEDAYGATGSLPYTLQIAVQAPTASAVNSTVTANTSNNQINLILGGGAATSVAVDTSPSHGTATVSGTDIAYTPTTGYSGPDSFTYTATNASGTSAPATVSIIVTPAALDITTGSLASGTVGSAYSQTLSTTNGTAPYTYTITGGSLPAGLTLSSTGVLSGTPSVDGSFNFTVSVEDTYGATGSLPYTLQIAVQAPTASPVNQPVPANTSNNPINLMLGGGAATSVAVDTSPSHGTATVSGTDITYTPTAGYSGPDSFTYTATNASGTSSPATVTITVTPPTLAITPANLASGTVGSAYSQTFSAAGGTAPYTYAITAGSLPDDLTLTADGTLSGTPSVNGSFNFSLSATDSYGATDSRSYSLEIEGAAVVISPLTEVLEAGQIATVDVSQSASGGPFTGAQVISVSPATAGRAWISSVAPTARAARIMSSLTLNFAPAVAFTGSAVVTFSLQNTSGSVGTGLVTFIVQPRPDPTKDPEVIGLLNAQHRSAERFANTQMDNVNRRLEQLHQMTCKRNSFKASLAQDGENIPLGAIASAVTEELNGTAPLNEQPRRPAASDAATDCQEQKWGFWSDGFINSGSTQLRGASDSSFTTVGLSAGVDYRLSPSLIAGFGIGYGNDRSDIGNHDTRSDADAIALTSYLSWSPAQQFFVDALLGYNRISFDSRRYISGSDNVYARGSRDADQLFSSLTGSYEYRHGHWLLTPYGRLNTSVTRLEANREKGGGIYALSFEKQRLQNITSFVGVRSSYDFVTSMGLLTPKIGLAWGHNFRDSSDFKMRYADQGDLGILYRLKPDAQDSDFADLDLGLSFSLGRTWQLDFSYKTALGEDERNDMFRLGLNADF